jgi:hypothetical protein
MCPLPIWERSSDSVAGCLGEFESDFSDLKFKEQQVEI